MYDRARLISLFDLNNALADYHLWIQLLARRTICFGPDPYLGDYALWTQHQLVPDLVFTIFLFVHLIFCFLISCICFYLHFPFKLVPEHNYTLLNESSSIVLALHGTWNTPGSVQCQTSECAVQSAFYYL